MFIRSLVLLTLFVVLCLGGKSSVCDPNSREVVKGYATHFKDKQYACPQWNLQKIKNTGNDCFVALNGVCGMDKSKYCNRCIEVTSSKGSKLKCRIVDFCDPKNCDYKDPVHLDILTNPSFKDGEGNYKKVETNSKGKNGTPAITWRWTNC